MKVNLVVRHTSTNVDCCPHICFYICSVIFDYTQIPLSPLAELQIMSLLGSKYTKAFCTFLCAVSGVTDYRDRVKYFVHFSCQSNNCM